VRPGSVHQVRSGSGQLVAEKLTRGQEQAFPLRLSEACKLLILSG
jgi:hypothetical protein